MRCYPQEWAVATH